MEAISMNRLNVIGQHISQAEPQVVYESNSLFLTITLNRPKALNSLSLQMINNLGRHLPIIKEHQAFWVQGAGGKAFCAGGDVKALFGKEATVEDRLTFFRNEFILDYNISTLKTVQISCWDGIVMGGGVGLSVFSPIIIATEKTVFAMPEAKLGFFTDVGANYILARLRNNIGYYLGMTGDSLRGEDVFIAGLAHFYIPSARLKQAYEQVSNACIHPLQNVLESVKSILSKYHSPSGRTSLNNESDIKQLFSRSSGKEVLLEALKQKNEFYTKVGKTLKSVCPISVDLIHRLITVNKKLSKKECFIHDFQVIQHMVQDKNFKEGVRCVLVQKGAIPNWSCKDLFQVNIADIQHFLKPVQGSIPLPIE